MKNLKLILKKTAVVLFWILVWYLIALKIDNILIFPGPLAVIKRLFELVITKKFWVSTLTSLIRVIIGLIVAIICGAAFAYLSYKFKTIYDILSPIMTVARATPVASFIILIALFIGSATVPSIITVVMVLPIVWQSTYQGFNDVSKELKEVCSTFMLSSKKQLTSLYLPAIMPHFTSAVITSIGLGWKAGIAAEILFPPLKSIGKAIADSNMLLHTTDLFAWTLVIILLSIIFETLTRLIIKVTSSKKTGGKSNENN